MPVRNGNDTLYHLVNMSAESNEYDTVTELPFNIGQLFHLKACKAVASHEVIACHESRYFYILQGAYIEYFLCTVTHTVYYYRL